MTELASRADADQRTTLREWGVLAVVCGALFLEGIDIAMLNVAVPAIAADIGLSTSSAHWIISAYVLGYAGFMLFGGRTADVFGRRRVFLSGLAVFVAFSGVGGVAMSSSVLIVARFITGVTAGFMTPAGFSIITTSFAEGAKRDRALTIYGAIGAGGFTLGMVAGGLLTSSSWRLVFFAPVVVGIAIFVAGWILIRRDDRSELAGARMDIGGAVTVTLAMASAVYAVVTFGETGVTAPAAVSAVLAVALVATFVAIQRRVAAPLLPLPLLRHGLLASVSVAGLLFMGAFAAFQFAITLYLQQLRGWTPLETGLTFAIMGADMAIAPLLTPRLVARFGNVSVMLAGLVTAVVAFTLALGLDASWTYWDFLPTLLLIAVSFAFVYGPLASAATEGLAESGHGVAGGVVYTGFQFGVALGVSAVTVVLVGAGGHVEGASSGDYTRSLTVPVVAAVLAVAAGLAARARQRSVGLTASAEVVPAARVG